MTLSTLCGKLTISAWRAAVSWNKFDQLPKEWRKLKRLACDTFKDKSYAGLYSTLLTKDPYKMDLKNILLLVQILLVLPISSANCKRAFSAQKRIKSDVRSSLSTSRLSDLIRISTEGPELELFDPSTASTKWLKSGKRKPFAKGWNAVEVMTESPKQETFFFFFFVNGLRSWWSWLASKILQLLANGDWVQKASVEGW